MLVEDWEHLRLATLRLRREIGRALWIDKIVNCLIKVKLWIGRLC